ncbi:MAG TPA: zf-HC2 domain-containing protein [Methylomirabilota bacterium]|jgi:anti-sigma factor RsiW|nr:zf-HC2 domain-containing protein [Methylomirabilota bacterium]
MHPESELTAYLTNALAPAERARVAEHLQRCAECRRALEESRAVLSGLAAVPAVPEPEWGRYRAELRARLEAPVRRAWWARPMPAMVAAGVAGVAVVLALQGHHERRPVELAAVEETMLGARLPLLEQYRVVERLDLLEDLEAIRHLDRLGDGGR